MKLSTVLLPVLLLLSLQLQAKSYKVCANSYANAKLELAAMINATVNNVQSSHVKSERQKGEESVTSTVEQINSIESHLDLVDMELYKKGGQKCVKIEKEAQVKHTKVLLTKTKTFIVKNLPNSGEKKVQVLHEWLEVIVTTQQMLNVFGEGITIDEKLELTNKYKKLSDLLTKTELNIASLVFKGCGSDKKAAQKALDQTIFTHNRQEKKKGFFSSMTSWVSSDDTPLKVTLFEPYITYKKAGRQECAYIVKSKLLALSQAMYSKSDGFKITLLSKTPKKRVETVDNWLQHLDVTYDLMKVYPEVFKPSQLQKIEALKVALMKERKSIIPQSIIFHVTGAEKSVIILNGEQVKVNRPVYLPKGSYAYSVKSDGFCVKKDDVSLDAFEDKVIEIDFSGYAYPTVLFVSDVNFDAMVDGIRITPNIRQSIKKCSQEVPYLVKFNGQSYQGTLDLDPGDTITKNFAFLNAQELAIISDAKTKKFKVSSDEKISERLSSYDSEKLTFSVVNQPTSGNLELDKSGHFIYTPDKKFSGKVSFDYIVDSENKKSSPKVAVIEVVGTKVVKAAAVPVVVKEVKKEIPKVEKEKKVQKEEKVAVKSKKKPDFDVAKFEAFLSARLKAKDMTTLKEAQKRFPEAFDVWMKKVRGK